MPIYFVIVADTEDVPEFIDVGEEPHRVISAEKTSNFGDVLRRIQDCNGWEIVSGSEYRIETELNQ